MRDNIEKRVKTEEMATSFSRCSSRPSASRRSSAGRKARRRGNFFPATSLSTCICSMRRISSSAGRVTSFGKRRRDWFCRNEGIADSDACSGS